MPTISPRAVTSGPPELPGFNAASVCNTSSIRRPERLRSERPSALTTPAVTVHANPRGLPIAHQLARPQSLGIPERRPAQGVGMETQHREIGVRIGADQIRLGAATVTQSGFDPAGALHDMAVGQREAVGGEGDTRAGRHRARPPFCPRCLQVEHGGRDRFGGRDDGAGIGVEELGFGRSCRFLAPARAVLACVGVA
jgi:hypothetical protein